MTVLLGRRIRRLGGYCSACDCLTSETVDESKEETAPVVACWNCGSTDLDFTYRNRNNIANFYQGALLSEIQSGDRLSFDDVSGEPVVEFTIFENNTLPPEYEWLMSVIPH